MQYTSAPLGGFLTRTPKWQAELQANGLDIRVQGKQPQSLAYERILSVTVSSPAIGWSTITIDTAQGTVNLKGVRPGDGGTLQQQLVAKTRVSLIAAALREERSLATFNQSLSDLMAKPTYLSASDRQAWRRSYFSSPDDRHKRLVSIFSHPLFDPAAASAPLGQDIERLYDFAWGAGTSIRSRNERFLKQELEACAPLFDTVEKQPLTDEQRRAAIVMEDCNLLVAPAGSGKTSALIGKIAYTLMRGLCEPSDILVLAFNNSARDELKERIQARLGHFKGANEIAVHTFHSLGQQIIISDTGKKPSLAKEAEDDGRRVALFKSIRDKLIQTDTGFLAAYIQFQAFYAKPAKSPANFETIEEWEDHLRLVGQTEGGKRGFKTFQGDLVKSEGEAAIANWLFVNGVDYKYEAPYVYETADGEHRQYHPDFFFPAVNVYLEHYALDASGKPPPAFGQKYLDAKEWKTALHEHYGTVCIETTFDEFIRGDIFDKLQEALEARGVRLTPRPAEEVLAKIEDWVQAEGDSLGQLMSVVARHTKSNRLTHEEIRAAARKSPSYKRAQVFVSMLLPVISAYEEKLRQNAEIDFDDMICTAAQLAETGRLPKQFQLILVDEFQDISAARADLVKAVRDHSPGSKLFAVGDDWQAIYRFAGSDIRFFQDFESIFGVTETMYLTRTFRFNQGIADVASKFVQANPAQRTKAVRSMSSDRQGSIVVCLAKGPEDSKAALLGALRRIASDWRPGEPPLKVLLLGRYKYLLTRAREDLKSFHSQELDLTFLTIHRSKGLEADYVILLEMNEWQGGFPSAREDDELVQMVMPHPEVFRFAEERRLFYVAMTRTKKAVYALASERTPSRFVREVVTDWSEEQLVRTVLCTKGKFLETKHRDCPSCATGWLTLRNGRSGSFYGCVHHPRCNFTETVEQTPRD